MRLQLNDIQQYIKDNYNLDFEITFDAPTEYEKYQDLVYKVGKKTYMLSVGYAQSNRPVDDAEYWSIYHDFMDYKKLHGYGGAEIDEGFKTIDKIMQEWGFKKQMNIFDFIGEE